MMISSQHGHALKTAHIQVVCIECRYRLSRSTFRISWAGITPTLSAEVGGWLLGLRMASVAGPYFFRRVLGNETRRLQMLEKHSP